MSDILIGGLIILGCLFVFGLMSVLVIDSHKKALAEKQKQELTITFTDIDQDTIVNEHMRQWMQMRQQNGLVKKPEPTLTELRSELELLMNRQQTAIDNEDYEQAAICRNELDALKLQLKKFEDDQTK